MQETSDLQVEPRMTARTARDLQVPPWSQQPGRVVGLEDDPPTGSCKLTEDEGSWCHNAAINK